MLKNCRYPAYPVPAGGYRISESKNEILNAYLGTCVGLTLCDKKARVGGLIHMLLPEPYRNDCLGRPGNYALTGLPLFIKEMCGRGSGISGLEATIAGGALVGNVSETDMDLDIGGRTVEVAEKILNNAGISVIKRETGGYFSCRLSLNLETMESDIFPIYDTPDIIDTEIEKPDAGQLNDAINKVHSIPQVVFKILRMVREEKYSLQSIAEEVKQDQVISAKLLKLVNSAFFNRRIQATSVDRALVLLGEKQMLQVVMSAAFEGFFKGNKKGYSQCKGGLYNHALGTALISEKIARITQCVSTDIAYTAGLLHDIGKVVLDQYMGRAYPFFYRKTQVDNENLVMAEKETFGITHDDVGAMLAEKWSLHESLIDSIKNHHNPDNAASDRVLVSLVYLSDLLMSRFLVGQELERMDAEHLKKSLHILGLDTGGFSNVIESIPPQIFQIPCENGIQNISMN
ncbi:MAG: HDOD domain-containing protein [Deltaproteobacteria bacterium]|nr:HDOD domain-containing protein [Deltaproteobacteria bacterium]